MVVKPGTADDSINTKKNNMPFNNYHAFAGIVPKRCFYFDQSTIFGMEF